MDLKTLFLVSHILNSVLTFFIFVIWLYYRREFKGIGLFIIGMLFLTCGNLAIGLRGIAGSFVSIVISNTSIVFGCLVMTQSFLLIWYGRIPKVTRLLFLLPFFVSIEQYIFTYIHPNLMVRIVSISLIVSFIMLINLSSIIGSGRLMTLPGALMSGVCAVLGLSMLIRAIVTPFTLTTDSFLSSGIIQELAIFVWMIAVITWALCIIILLFNNLKKKEELNSLEKGRLIREIDHRVKNNLNSIHALLNLHYAVEEELKVKNIIREIDNRIGAFSKIHTLLYKHENIETVSLKSYITEISNHVFSNYTLPNVELKIAVVDISIKFNTALNFGLIVNELVTNCCKHAFAQNDQGVISVSLQKNDFTDEYKLVVSDNGKGLGEGFDIHQKTTMGMMIIKNISEQLHGKFEIESDATETFFKVYCPVAH